MVVIRVAAQQGVDAQKWYCATNGAPSEECPHRTCGSDHGKSLRLPLCELLKDEKRF